LYGLVRWQVTALVVTTRLFEQTGMGHAGLFEQTGIGYAGLFEQTGMVKVTVTF
jgi:hypothetical protein